MAGRGVTSTTQEARFYKVQMRQGRAPVRPKELPIIGNMAPLTCRIFDGSITLSESFDGHLNEKWVF